MSRSRILLLGALAVALVQIAILVSMIAGRAAILRNGTEIMLAVQPVDPRDLLRGDYVVLGYNISMVPVDVFAGVPEEGAGSERTVHVRLAADEAGIFQPVAASFDEPLAMPAGQGEVDLRGWSRYWASRAGAVVPVEYGIERFYVPEGEGLDIERGMGLRDFIMKVAVGRDGTAQIKAFYDGDRMLYEEPWY